jgi:hypothetical protein
LHAYEERSISIAGKQADDICLRTSAQTHD